MTEAKAGESTLRSFGYDADNLLSSATDAEGHKIEIGHNEDGLVSSIKDGRGQSLTRSYNSRGELTKEIDGRGTLEYGYDNLGRLTSLTDPQGKSLGFGYDAEDDLTEITRPNAVTTTNVYNEAGRLAETNSVEGGEPPTTLESLKYGYDQAGNVTSRIDQRLEAETTYAYDGLNRLTEFNPPGEGATSYGYDKAGNRTEADGTTYSYNSLNQLVESSSGTTYTYDGAGRMTGMANGAGEVNYKWEPLDHLARIEGAGGTVSYAYDALGRLSQRTSESATRVMHYGDLTDLPTYDASAGGGITSSYVQGADGLVEQRAGEATAYPLADAHGNITAISGATGGIESRQAFDPWGVQISGPPLEMGYLGAQERRTDPATSLVQMGERVYGPGYGGFLSEDPVYGHFGIGASVDRYLYVRDNPLGLFDLSGRDVCVPTPLGGACAEEAAEDVASGAEDAWNLTSPARHWISNRAQDFEKYASTHTFGACVSGFAGAGVGISAQLCVVGNLHNIGTTESFGGGASLPFGAGVGAGPIYSNASSASMLGGRFDYGGAGIRPFAGPTLGFNAASGSSGGRTIETFHPWVGLSAGPPVSGEAGVSWTETQSLSW
jgi:RHS repeat-associated protein